MNTKKILLLALFLLSVSFFAPKTLKAVDSPQKSVSASSFVVRIIERIEYFFAFKVEQKVAVLEKQAENRLNTARDSAAEGNKKKVQTQIQGYLQAKEKQNNLLEKAGGEEVLEKVEERTIEQQKTMEAIKTKVDEDVKQKVVQVQEQVVNQVAKRIIDTNGQEGATEFFQKVEHVWAPGTGPGGESGVVIKGGSMQFAPGTSTGGNSGADIKTVEVKGN